MDEISDVDRDAFTRAIIACRAQGPARSRQIDAMLTHRSWEEVGKFAAYCAQGRSLDVQPWANVPMYARFPDLKKPFGDPRGEREAAEILKQLVEHNLSRFEPDPLAAIAAAEAKRDAK